MSRHVYVCGSAHSNVGVTAISKYPLQRDGGGLELLFLQAVTHLQRSSHSPLRGRHEWGGHAREAMDVDPADEHLGPLVDHDLHADPACSGIENAACSNAGPIETSGTIVTLDALQVALQHVAVEYFVVVDDAREQTEKARALPRRNLALYLLVIQRAIAADLDAFDSKMPPRNSGAA
jgi:hypothetical protein